MEVAPQLLSALVSLPSLVDLAKDVARLPLSTLVLSIVLCVGPHSVVEPLDRYAWIS